MANKASNTRARSSRPSLSLVAFDATIGKGEDRKVLTMQAAPLDAAGIDALSAKAADAIRSAMDAERNAGAKAWTAAGIGADLWKALRAGGMSDKDATDRIRRTAKEAGMDKTTAGRMAQAARGLAAGLSPEDGEGYKAFAVRCGSPEGTSGGAGKAKNRDAVKAEAGTLKRCAAKLADVVADLTGCPSVSAEERQRAIALLDDIKVRHEKAEAKAKAAKAAKAAK